MSDMRSAIWVTDVSPRRLSINVALDTEIIVQFDRDIAVASLNSNTFIVLENSVLPIAGTITYDNISRKAVFTPDSNLNSNTTYMVTLVGQVPGDNSLDNYIKSVDDIPMPGNYSYTFVTANTVLPATPRLLTPNNQSVSDSGVIYFSWSIVTNADHYEIQVATNTSFSILIWEDIATQNNITRSSPFPDGVYYWRVRAVNNIGQKGNWSSMFSLRVGEVPELTDEPVSYIPPIQGFPSKNLEKFMVTRTIPSNESTNVALDLSTIRVFLNYPLDSGYSSAIEIVGYNIADELMPSGHFPVVSGNIFYSGATYTDWLLTGPVPSGYEVLASGQTLLNNQEYSVTIMPYRSIYGDISDEYTFKFYTPIDPLYVTIDSQRNFLGETLADGYTDLDLAKLIHKYSLIVRTEVDDAIISYLDNGLMSKSLQDLQADTSGELEIRKNIECFIRNSILVEILNRKLQDNLFDYGLSKRLGDFSYSKNIDGYRFALRPLLDEANNLKNKCLNSLKGNKISNNVAHALRGGSNPYFDYDEEYRRL